MIGGRFTVHGRASFTVRVTARSHCTVRGMEDLSINEGTYNHQSHSDSKLIFLMR